MHALGIDIGGSALKGAPVDTKTGKLLGERFKIDAPVAKGVGDPVVGESGPPPVYVHGNNGLGDVPIPDKIAKQADPRPAPGLWGPYFGAMLPDWWLNEGGQSAAGSLIDWTLRESDAWSSLVIAARQSNQDVYAVANEWVAALQAREDEPTQDLHVLPDHHGNRSPRADPDSPAGQCRPRRGRNRTALRSDARGSCRGFRGGGGCPWV